MIPVCAALARPQVTSHDEGPCVCVWDSRVGSQQGEPQLAKLQFSKEDRGAARQGHAGWWPVLAWAVLGLHAPSATKPAWYTSRVQCAVEGGLRLPSYAQSTPLAGQTGRNSLRVMDAGT